MYAQPHVQQRTTGAGKSSPAAPPPTDAPSEPEPLPGVCAPSPEYCDELSRLQCRIECPLVPESVCKSIWPPPVPYTESPDALEARLAAAGCSCSRKGRWAYACRNLMVDPINSRYMTACIVFIAYSVVILLIDIFGYGGWMEPVADVDCYPSYTSGGLTPTFTTVDGGTATIYGTDPGLLHLPGGITPNTTVTAWQLMLAISQGSTWSMMSIFPAPGERWTQETVNKLYVALNWVHLINAFQYIWCYKGKKWYDKILIADLFNVVAAVRGGGGRGSAWEYMSRGRAGSLTPTPRTFPVPVPLLKLHVLPLPSRGQQLPV